MRVVLNLAHCLALIFCTAAAPTRQVVSEPSDAHLDAALEAVQGTADQARDFQQMIEADTRKALAGLSDLNLERVVRLAALRELSRLFLSEGAVTDQTRETVEWLVQQPDLLRTLMLAATEDDAAADVLSVLSRLYEAEGNALLAAPDLVAAICIVWDVPPQRPGSTETDEAADERVAGLFRYYAGTKSRLTFDVKSLPWQLSVYVVDNAAGEDEIAWARKRYQRKGFTARCYFEVPYDTGAFRSGVPARISAHDYTLSNLIRYGGVCRDQAYFAAHVAKSFGIPATVCAGQGGASGGGHAWVGYLQQTGRRVAWNFNEGRYRTHLYWSGKVIDPQSGASLSDADVAMLAELQSTGRLERLASVALWKLRDLVEEDRELELLMKAIDLSPGNRPAWIGLAALGASGKLSQAQAAKVAEVVQRVAFGRYPEFAFSINRRLVEGRPAAEQLKAYERVIRTFSARPDLVAAARIAQGDLLRDQNRRASALKAYGDVLMHHLKAGPIVLTAVERTDEMLREDGKLDQLADIYAHVWAKMPAPKPSAFANTSPYYMLGERYAALLEQMNRTSAATVVRRKLDDLHVEGKG